MGEFSLVAEERQDTGKGVARKLRAAGRIPAVLYGPGKPARPLVVDPHALDRVLRSSGSGMNTLIDLSVGGEETVVLVKEIQRDPVRGRYLHADLVAIDLQKKVEVAVPLHFVGKAAGLDQGGIVDHPLREVNIECLPREIPEFFEVDVTSLEIGDSLHVRDLVLPEGMRMLSDEDLPTASCVAPRVEEEEAPAEGIEGEVAGEAEGAAPAAEGGDASGEGGDS